MISKKFFWEIIFKLRRAPIFQKLICIWHSYNTTVIKWWSHNSKIYYLIISKLSKNIYHNNPKRLSKFEGCSLTLLKVMPTVPGLLTHPVGTFRFIIELIIFHEIHEMEVIGWYKLILKLTYTGKNKDRDTWVFSFWTSN